MRVEVRHDAHLVEGRPKLRVQPQHLRPRREGSEEVPRRVREGSDKVPRRVGEGSAPRAAAARTSRALGDLGEPRGASGNLG